jgi:hypothetical protein
MSQATESLFAENHEHFFNSIGRLVNRPISGKPEIGCKRGRERTDFAARAEPIPTV